MSSTNGDSDYTRQWQDLRSRIIAFCVAWPGGFIGMIVLSRIGVPEYLGVALWMAAFYVTGWRWTMFPCPRCGKVFFKPSTWSSNQFLRKCPHCGLSKWAEHDDSAAPKPTLLDLP